MIAMYNFLRSAGAQASKARSPMYNVQFVMYNLQCTMYNLPKCTKCLYAPKRPIENPISALAHYCSTKLCKRQSAERYIVNSTL